MSDADELRPTASAATPERSPLVDRLLMSGLDEYFSGRYERAIQVWSRVFFLDRNHARARAYIDRARSALAETQREAEARGGPELDREAEPRSLIGAFGLEPTQSSSAPDPALQVHGALAAVARRAPGPSPGVAARVVTVSPRRFAVGRPGHVVLILVAGVLLFGAGYTIAARDRLAQWWQAARLDGGARSSTLSGALGARSADDVLASVRHLLERGRFDDALRALALIRVDDPRRPEADALWEEVRRAVATGVAPAAGPPVRLPSASGSESR